MENRPFGIIDLHCDTLTDTAYTSTGAPDPLNDPKRVISFDALPKDVHWAQMFAVFVPDELRGVPAVEFFQRHADSFHRQMEKFSGLTVSCVTGTEVEEAWQAGKTASILTVEGGAALGGALENVKLLADRGVRCMTLVWNGENEIASGNMTDHGFTNFGRLVVPEMERCGILVDVSHLNDRGFFELLDLAEKPFVATHSNARAVCGHKRNLTDEMIGQMVQRDCLIGLNYYINFLDDACKAETPDFMYRHIAHFYELGAEKNLALGSDFDGSDLPAWLNTPEKVAELYGYLLSRNFTALQLDGLFYRNALEFLKQN